MLIHYLRVAWRIFRRNMLYSLINIACLAVGLGVVMTILLYVLHEHSYDKWHAHSERIFVVQNREYYGDRNFWTTGLSYMTGAAINAGDPAVESMVRTFAIPDGADLNIPASPGMHFRETSGFCFADTNFFNFFSFRLLQGKADHVLSRPMTVVLTEKTAKKYFGKADPIGKILLMDGKYPLEVTGVAAEPPSNSSIEFTFLASMASMPRLDLYHEYQSGSAVRAGWFSTWVRLRKSSDTAAVVKNLKRLSLLGEGKETALESGMTVYKSSHDFRLRAIADSHLTTVASQKDKYLSAFSWAAGLILLLALVNYMSLATARSAVRAKEVGVRKVMGAARKLIAGQFYTESALYALFSFFTGFLFFLWFRTYFCRLIQMPIDAGFIFTPTVLGAFGVLLLFVIIAAGSYPALLLSAFRPVAVLYGKFNRQRSGERMRKGFIVVQFSLSMSLMICSIVIGKQLYFFRHADTGIDRENIVMIPFAGTMKQVDAFKNEIQAMPQVREVSTSLVKLYDAVMNEQAYLPGQTSAVDLEFMVVDTSFIRVLGLKWKEPPVNGSKWCDSNHLVLNETAVSQFHLDGNAVGRQFKFANRMVTVAGVLKDFNFFALNYRITPFSLCIYPRVVGWDGAPFGYLYLKVGTHINMPTLIDEVRKTYGRYDAQTPFEFQFLDDSYNASYKLEDQLAKFFDLFSIITIAIGCLGLFALATFAAQQRLKEIGIRKVLGASVTSISALLSRDFLQPILVAILIACPLAWWVMDKWLQNFAYRTPISWWIFPAGGLGLLIVAQLTVLFRTVRAARANPTITLRNE